MSVIDIGYVPLTDALPLLLVKKLQLDAEHGIAIELHRMGSWAQVRDALLTRQLHAAHCLPGIPLATQAGLYGDVPQLASAFTLNHYGNAITISQQLLGDTKPDQVGARLRALKDEAIAQGRRLCFASVFPVSKHEFELRYWLRSYGLNPETDLRLIVVPPPQMAQALEMRRIDGFCVGEPWNTLTRDKGLGQIVSSSRSLDLPGTEKVLAVRQDWIEDKQHFALLKAVKSACDWLQVKRNRQTAAGWLAELLQIDSAATGAALINHPSLTVGNSGNNFVEFSGINRPRINHATWLLDQARSQLGLDSSIAPEQVCQRAFRPDIYDRALD